MLCAQKTAPSAATMANPLRGRLMVGRLTLDQVVKVRVLAPQPSRADDPDELKRLRGRRAKGSQALCGLGAQRPPRLASCIVLRALPRVEFVSFSW